MTSPKLRRRNVLFAGAATSLATALPGWAATPPYPSNVIRLISPYPPGGTSSAILNRLAERLQSTSPLRIIVDYKTGAGGNIGVDAVLKAPPDGYTIGFTAMNSFAINPHLTKKLPYDAENDVQFITLLGAVPNVIAVNPNVSARDLRELIALSKTTDLSFASPGIGTSVHLAGEMLMHDAGLKMNHIPYRGESPALQDVLGGRVQVMLANLTGVIEYLRSGRLRGIAVTSSKRSSAVPDLPTVSESGVPGFDVKGYFVLFTSKGVPEPVLDTLQREVNKVLATTEFRTAMSQIGLDVLGGTRQEVAALVNTESTRWAKVVKRTGVTWD